MVQIERVEDTAPSERETSERREGLHHGLDFKDTAKRGSRRSASALMI
jgi:hypothetical protein